MRNSQGDHRGFKAPTDTKIPVFGLSNNQGESGRIREIIGASRPQLMQNTISWFS